MRYLLYLLVVLNLLLLLWIYQFDEQLPPRQDGHPQVGELRIVSEEQLQQARRQGQHTDDEDLQRQDNAVESVRHLAQENEATTAAGDLCASLGPLAGSRQATDLAAKLATMQQQATLRSEAVVNETYEVVLPPLKSRFAASRKLQELQRAGIEGAEKIRSGKYLKGITFGVFHYRDDAYRRLLGVSQFAENAEIVVRTERRERYWVDIDSRPDRELSEQQVATLRDQFSGVEFHQAACEQRQ